MASLVRSTKGYTRYIDIYENDTNSTWDVCLRLVNTKTGSQWSFDLMGFPTWDEAYKNAMTFEL